MCCRKNLYINKKVLIKHAGKLSEHPTPKCNSEINPEQFLRGQVAGTVEQELQHQEGRLILGY